MKRAGLAAVATGLLLTAHASAAAPAAMAEKSLAALSLRRPEGVQGCLTLGELARRVEAHLGRKGLVSAAEASVFIDAAIESLSPQGFRATITLSNQAEQVLGVRELVQETSGCSEVAEAAALAIALMIDPNAGAPAGDRVAPVAAPVVVAPVNAVPTLPAACPVEAAPVVDADRQRPARLPWRARVMLGPLAAGRGVIGCRGFHRHVAR